MLCKAKTWKAETWGRWKTHYLTEINLNCLISLLKFSHRTEYNQPVAWTIKVKAKKFCYEKSKGRETLFVTSILECRSYHKNKSQSTNKFPIENEPNTQLWIRNWPKTWNTHLGWRMSVLRHYCVVVHVSTSGRLASELLLLYRNWKLIRSPVGATQRHETYKILIVLTNRRTSMNQFLGTLDFPV